MKNSNFYKTFNSELINSVRDILDNINHEENKLFLKNNYTDNSVCSTIKFLNGEYTEKEEELFISIYNN